MYINNDIDYIKFLADKDVYIFGAGERGIILSKRCKKNNLRVRAFLDNNIKESVNGIPCIHPNSFLEANKQHSMIIIATRYEAEIRKQLLDNGVFNFISEHQIDWGGGSDYYDEIYFSEQEKVGEIRAEIKKSLFEPYITEDMTIVEFGSATGYLLKKLNAREKIGIEINKSARDYALKKLGIKSVQDAGELQDECADLIFSTSVLEHVESPLYELKKLYRKLKSGGKIVFLVPNESCNTEYMRSEFNNHLYTWNCLNIGNLFKAAGFFVKSVEIIEELWPREYVKLKNELGDTVFNEICEIRGKAFEEKRCFIVAEKS